MRSRFLRIISFGTILLLVGGALFIFSTLRHSIHAQRADLLAAAARYPKFTLEQRMAVSRARASLNFTQRGKIFRSARPRSG